MQCAAKSKRTQKRCRRSAMIGKQVCMIHGGKSLAGIASPRLGPGIYSEYLPVRLRERYNQAEKDSPRLQLNAEINLIDARLIDVLGRVDTGESGASWKAARDAYRGLQSAIRKQDEEGTRRALAKLRTILDEGWQDYQAWDEVRSLVEQRKRLVESERKRMVEMGQMITASQAMVLVTRLTDIIATHVTDPKQRITIANELVRLVSVDAGWQPVTD